MTRCFDKPPLTEAQLAAKVKGIGDTIASRVTAAKLLVFDADDEVACAPAPNPPALDDQLYIAESFSPAVMEIAAGLGARDMHITSVTFDVNERWELPQGELDKLIAHIEATTAADYNAPLCIGWEGKGLAALNGDHGEGPQEVVLRAALEVLATVQHFRPHAKVGFYALPEVRYWAKEDEWLARMERIKPLFDASGAIFPRLYMPYDASQGNPNHEYVEKITRVVEAVAPGTPAYWCIWHRIHDSNRDGFAEQLIPLNDWLAYLFAAGPKRLAWWHCDDLMRRTAEWPSDMPKRTRYQEIFAAEMQATGAQTIAEHLDTIHEDYLVALVERLKGQEPQ